MTAEVLALNELQKAIYQRLTANAALQAAAAQISDYPDDELTFPAVVIGDVRDDGRPTKSGSVSQVRVGIEIHSRGRGYLELNTLVSAVVNELSSAGFVLENNFQATPGRRDQLETFPEEFPEGITVRTATLEMIFYLSGV